MTVVGIIAEYNPLHIGHEYHLRQAKDITQSDCCVVILSSNFVQRGEPALVSKWARTKMALLSGADLVIELPCAFSCSSAEYFASASISILEGLNFVDYLCFGSEEGTLEPLEETANLLAFESKEFKDNLKSALNEGLSFAAAREKAVNSLSSKGILNKPNNILGVEYIKALKRAGSSIRPVTIKRLGQGYNSIEKASSYSSATSIRDHLSGMDTNGIKLTQDKFLINNISSKSLEILQEEIRLGRGPVFFHFFENALLHMLRTTTEERLALLPYMGEGLENRLKNAAIKSICLEALVSNSVTSRYPASRIKRILCALMTGMSSELLENLKTNGYAQYIRILGFNEKGRKILASLKKRALLPIITKPAFYRKNTGLLGKELFEHEIRATNAYVLGFPNIEERIGGMELSTSPIYV